MRPKILTYVPPGGGRRRSRRGDGIIAGDDASGRDAPIEQYRRRKPPRIPADLKWGCLWMALLLGAALMMTITDGGL